MGLFPEMVMTTPRYSPGKVGRGGGVPREASKTMGHPNMGIFHEIVMTTQRYNPVSLAFCFLQPPDRVCQRGV